MTEMTNTLSIAQIYKWLEAVPDPEIPVVSVLDLGIVRDVIINENTDTIIVTITPTYSGCPAMDLIGQNIKSTLLGHGIPSVKINMQLQPAWTTDWITDEGKQKMKNFGIAPPKRLSKNGLSLFEIDAVECPKCNSHHTELVSQFASTSCKALYRCLECKEPFEHFKCH